MRVVMIDTNEPKNGVTYPLDVMQPCFKEIEKLTLLRNRTTEEDVERLDPENIMGYIDHIKPYKGVFRGDITFADDDMAIIAEGHFEHGGKIHIAMEITGTKTNEMITISQVHSVYYAYLKEIGEE